MNTSEEAVRLSEHVDCQPVLLLIQCECKTVIIVISPLHEQPDIAMAEAAVHERLKT